MFSWSEEMESGEDSGEEKRKAKTKDNIDVRQRSSVLILAIPQEVN